MRKFGIELEFSQSLEDIVDLTKPFFIKKEREIDHNRNLKSTGETWQFKVDGTTLSEISTPAITMDSPEMERLHDMMEVFKENSVKVTKKDSVHVHISTKDIDKRKLLIAWLYWELPILSLFPKHRRLNRYCDRYVKNHRMNQIVAHHYKNGHMDADHHHQVMNWYERKDRQTIEFRPMEGTLDYDDVIGWLNFIFRFVEYSQNIDEVEVMAESNKTKNEDLEFIRDVDLDRWVDGRKERFM